MIKHLTILSFLIFITACSSQPQKVRSQKVEAMVTTAEKNTTDVGKKIIETSKTMIDDNEIIVGGCWNYIDSVFSRAGYTPKKRVTVYKSKYKGPYLKEDLIQPGDWLYYVNHSYGRSEHSGIFIGWVDKSKKEALMVSYPGEKRREPASFKTYNLKNIYNVIRAQD